MTSFGPGRGNADTDTAQVVVCGSDDLAYRTVVELVARYRARVVVLTMGGGDRDAEIARLPVRTVPTRHLDADAFRRAGLADANAVALLDQDDVGNIRTALIIREINPDARVVLRMFDQTLGAGVRSLLLGDTVVVSDAALAGEAFVDAALDAPTVVCQSDELGTLYTAPRQAVPGDQVVCGLAVTCRDRLELLPGDANQADLVLARVATGHVPVGTPRPARRTTRQGGTAGLLRRLRRLSSMVSRPIRTALIVMLVLCALGSTLIAWAEALDPVSAVLIAIAFATNGWQLEFDRPVFLQIVSATLALLGVGLVPLLAAAVTEAVINSRLVGSLGRLSSLGAPVVVVGLGNVGTAVILNLHAQGVPVIAVDSSEQARGVDIARQLNIPVLVQDATRMQALDAVPAARALIVVTSDDVVNLETALRARSRQPNLSIVLRLADDELASRVAEAFGIQVSRSVAALAAPAFAASLMSREMLGIIPVKRDVLLLAEFAVGASSQLDGALTSTAEAPGLVRVIAVSHGQDRPMLFPPFGDPRLKHEHRVIAVGTSAGLGRLLTRVESPLR
ncbi:NAD-binding protein [Plantactinospora sp. B5E13]|uniref:NAD-binding protein n=1 Tax=unclassified Plantactinospora TaxID=2631981 RepID=UPI00325C4188